MATNGKNGSEHYLPFEKPIAELEAKVRELEQMSTKDTDLTNEIKVINKKIEETRKDIFCNLTPWQRVQVARHPHRPYTLDYINFLFTHFIELHGDRYFADDKAIVGGFARFKGKKVVVMGHQKGRDTKENLMRNFGSAHPEGYRKALRLMKLAEKFNTPVITFIDTPGAYPGVGAEERGQSSAIAINLREMAELTVPVIVIVIGEGGSGGALGIGIGNRIAILENAYYSVISPEGCAAILWKDNTRAMEAAESLKLTSDDLLNFKVVDDVIKEPFGGAHRNPEKTAKNMETKISKYLEELTELSGKQLVEDRYNRFRQLGILEEKAIPKKKTGKAREAAQAKAG